MEIRKWPSVYRSFGNFIFSKIVDNFVIYQERVCGNWVIWCFESFFLIIKRNTIWKEWMWSFSHLVFLVIHLKMIGHLVFLVKMKHYFLGLLVILEMLKYSSQFVTFKVSGHRVIWCFRSFRFFWNEVFGHWVIQCFSQSFEEKLQPPNLQPPILKPPSLQLSSLQPPVCSNQVSRIVNTC